MARSSLASHYSPLCRVWSVSVMPGFHCDEDNPPDAPLLSVGIGILPIRDATDNDHMTPEGRKHEKKDQSCGQPASA